MPLTCVTFYDSYSRMTFVTDAVPPGVVLAIFGRFVVSVLCLINPTRYDSSETTRNRERESGALEFTRHCRCDEETRANLRRTINKYWNMDSRSHIWTTDLFCESLSWRQKNERTEFYRCFFFLWETTDKAFSYHLLFMTNWFIKRWGTSSNFTKKIFLLLYSSPSFLLFRSQRQSSSLERPMVIKWVF